MNELEENCSVACFKVVLVTVLQLTVFLETETVEENTFELFGILIIQILHFIKWPDEELDLNDFRHNRILKFENIINFAHLGGLFFSFVFEILCFLFKFIKFLCYFFIF